MLFFFAGAPKNGSHFQYFLVKALLDECEAEWHATDWSPFDKFDYPKAEKALDECANSEKLYLTKGHWGSRKEVEILERFSSNGKLVAFLIWRDLKDTLVSAFFYSQNARNRNFDSFREFYLLDGKIFLLQQCLYRKTWSKTGIPKFEASFESMKTDLFSEIDRLTDFLKLGQLTNDQKRRIREAISLERLRKKTGDKTKLFRKGAVGEWKKVIDSKTTLEIEKIQSLPEEELRRLLKKERAYYFFRHPGRIIWIVRNLKPEDILFRIKNFLRD